MMIDIEDREESESRQHYATVQTQELHRRLNAVGHPPTFAQLLSIFRKFGTLYDVGFRSIPEDVAA